MALPATFRFKGQGLLAIAELLISLVFAIPLILIEQRRIGLPSAGEVILTVIAVSFAFGAILDLRQKSDIVVDDNCIARRLFGWTWQKIPWSDIYLIKVIPFFHPAIRKVVRIISFHRTASPRISLLRYGKLGFFDQAENMNDLTMLINHYAAIHHIKIEASENGVTRSIPSI